MTPDYSTISRVHFQGKNSEVKTPLYWISTPSWGLLNTNCFFIRQLCENCMKLYTRCDILRHTIIALIHMQIRVENAVELFDRVKSWRDYFYILGSNVILFFTVDSKYNLECFIFMWKKRKLKINIFSCKNM